MPISAMLKIFVFIILNTSITSWRHKNIRKPILLMDSSDKKKEQCIISSKNKKIYCNSEAKLFVDKNEYLREKKLITISPGGFKGFYLLGVLTYIKEKYNTDNLIYSGASAGSWNSLFMCYKGDTLSFVYNLLDYNIKKAKSITELEYFIKYKLLSNYKDEDFDLKKIFIGVTTLKNFIPRTNIFSDFETLEDAINCCFASSHIPFITGGITNKYHDMFTFDGGFSNYPYLDKERILHISPSMWNNLDNNSSSIKRSIMTVRRFSEFFSISKNNLIELFDDGYQDAKKHKEFFDSILEQKNLVDIYNDNENINEDAPDF
jgi:hypothetical protein